MSAPSEIGLRWMPENTYDQKSPIFSDNALLWSGNKPLSEPMLAQVYVAVWRN